MTKFFKLEGLDCANCAAKIERAISKIKGIDEASVDFMTTKLFIESRDINDELFEEMIKAIHKVDGNIIVKGA